MDRRELVEEFGIHSSYLDFFTPEKLQELEKILEVTTNEPYTPSRENIFKALSFDLYQNRVVLLGMDPYPQAGVATGLAFEVESASWDNKQVNASLKNILKLIYKTYYGELLTLADLRKKINSGEFPILTPDKLFKYLSSNGVMFLNTALTTRVGQPGSHIMVWRNFIIDLIRYIDEKNIDLTYLLWGGKAQNYEKYIRNGEIIKHNHPAICGKLDNPNDFLNGVSFELTKNRVNWLGK